MSQDPQPLLTRMMSAAATVPGGTDTRILDAALAEFTEFGLRRVTMEDVARRAGVHRVTIYRRFDGKNALVQAVILRELHAFLTSIGEVMHAERGGLADQVAEGFVFTLRSIRTHPLLTRLLSTEPENLLPFLTVQGGPFLTMASQYLAARLRASPDAPDWLAEQADEVAETQIRLMLTFVFVPAGVIPLTDEAEMREYARRRLAPMVTGRPPS
ncbi:MAG: TetR/AcrR family transcriptional regulator [Actinomadura sp.]